jgi:hypothetical protein
MILFRKKEIVLTHATHCCVILRPEPMPLLYNTPRLVGRVWDEQIADTGFYGEAVWGTFAPIDVDFVHEKE